MRNNINLLKKEESCRPFPKKIKTGTSSRTKSTRYSLTFRKVQNLRSWWAEYLRNFLPLMRTSISKNSISINPCWRAKSPTISPKDLCLSWANSTNRDATCTLSRSSGTTTKCAAFWFITFYRRTRFLTSWPRGECTGRRREITFKCEGL